MSQAVLLEKSPVIPLNIQLAKALGVCQALLLQQIHYFTTTRPVEKDGRGWCYYTHKEWSDHLGVYEERSVRKAISELVSLGLVLVGRYNSRKYDRTSWYSINYDRLKQWVSDAGLEGTVPTTDWQKLPQPSGKKCRTQSAEIAAPIHKIEDKTGKEELCTLPQKPNIEGEVELPKPTSTSIILASLKQAKAPTLPSKTNASALGKVWTTEVAKLPDSHGCLPSLTVKELGHLGRLLKLWGDKAPDIVKCVVRDWGGYSKYVEQAKGLKTRPLRPYIGFLYTHHNDALVYYTEQSVQLSSQPASPTVPATQPVKKYKPTEKPMTMEEFLKAIAD